MSDKEDDEAEFWTEFWRELKPPVCAEPAELWSVSLECAVPEATWLEPAVPAAPPVCAVPAAPPVCAVPAVRRDWNRSFASNYEAVPASIDRCDRVSEAFNQSTMDRMIIICSHGGVVDDGTNQPLKQPMFRTGQPVIFPVRYGSTIRIRPTWMTDILSNLPVSTDDHPKLTGEQLIFGLERGLNLPNTCIRQHDAGTNVSNLELFTPGVHLGDDDIVLVDTDTAGYRTCRSLRPHFRKMNIKSVPKKLKKTVKKNGKKILLNEKPLFRTSSRYKREMGQQEDHPLTLADLCDKKHGLFKKLTIDGYKLSKLPVVVLACRAGIAWDSGSTTSSDSSNKSNQVNTPVSSDYSTVDSTADDDMDESPQGNDDDGYRFTRRNDRFPGFTPDDDDRFPGGGGPAQEDRFTGRVDDFGCWNDGEDRFPDDFGNDMDEGGSRNATKKRGNRRRNATKKRGNRRRNATKKRGNRRRNATKKRRK
jgi:hypothetical protein